MEVTAPTPGLPWGVDIGASRGQVERALGEPQELSDARSMYAYSDAFPNTVHVHFRDDRVYRIEWYYWVTLGFQPRERLATTFPGGRVPVGRGDLRRDRLVDIQDVLHCHALACGRGWRTSGPDAEVCWACHAGQRLRPR